MAEEANSTTKGLAGTAVIAALLVLLAYIAFTAYLVIQSGTDETHWTRLAFVYGGLEAVVFAAAGALFGTSFQIQRAKKAEERAEKSEQKAEENAAASQALRAVKAQLRISKNEGAGPGAVGGLGREKVGAAGEGEPPPPSVEQTMAERLLLLIEEIEAAET